MGLCLGPLAIAPLVPSPRRAYISGCGCSRVPLISLAFLSYSEVRWLGFSSHALVCIPNPVLPSHSFTTEVMDRGRDDRHPGNRKMDDDNDDDGWRREWDLWDKLQMELQSEAKKGWGPPPPWWIKHRRKADMGLKVETMMEGVAQSRR